MCEIKLTCWNDSSVTSQLQSEPKWRQCVQ